MSLVLEKKKTECRNKCKESAKEDNRKMPTIDTNSFKWLINYNYSKSTFK
jgi:hypothetical protein